MTLQQRDRTIDGVIPAQDLSGPPTGGLGHRWRTRLARGDRVALGLTFAVFLVLGFMVFGFRSSNQVASNAQELNNDAFAEFQTADALRSLHQQKVVLVARYVNAPEQNRVMLRSDLVALDDRFDAVLDQAIEQADGVDVALLDVVGATHEEVDATENRVLELIDAGNPQEARVVLLDETRSDEDRLDDALEAFFEDQNQDVAQLTAEVVDGTREAQVIVIVVLGTIAAILFALLRTNRQQKVIARRRDHERNAFAANQVRRSRIRNGFEMSLTESDTLATFRAVVDEELPGWNSELLLADSSTAHLQRAVTTNPSGEPACGVASPTDCPAIRRGDVLLFDDVESYDSCPHLRNRDLEGGTAVCVPLKVMGKSIGISHSVAAAAPSQDDIDKVIEIVQVGGDRLGVLRAFATTNRRASRDPLTGLLNRRTMEEEVHALDNAGRAYSVAFCDLDHFKDLNDTHGHATGDRALRLFSETLTKSVRPTDLCARWGGEEFVVVLPDTDVDDAAETIERFRDELSLALMNATLPQFTFSAGVAQSMLSFQHTTAMADAALLDAKGNGRDRVIVATTVPDIVPGAFEADESEHPSTSEGSGFAKSGTANG